MRWYRCCETRHAKILIKHAATLHYPPALLWLFNLYRKDRMCGPADPHRAEKWKVRASGHVAWFRERADRDSASALDVLNYGYCASFGIGLPQDKAVALEYYCRSAAMGDEIALFNLGVYFDTGLGGLEKNPTAAVLLYQEAAVRDNVPAQFNLGVCYEFGTGVEKNTSLAAEWYAKASQRHDYEACRRLGNLYECGEGTLRKDEVMAVKYYRMGADGGHASCMCSLANCYDQGSGTAEDKVAAAHWFEESAKNNSRVGQYNTAVYYEQGMGGKVKSIARAAYWYGKSAEQGMELGVKAMARMKDLMRTVGSG